MDAFDLLFLSNRGLYIPSPQVAEGLYAFIIAIIIALAISVGVFRYNRKHQIKTGQLRKTWPVGAALIVGLPSVTHWLFGAALHRDIPHLRGFCLLYTSPSPRD